MPEVEVVIDDNHILPSPTSNSTTMKQTTTITEGDATDGNNNVLAATEKISMKYSRSDDGMITCEHCGQIFKKLGGLSTHYLRRHAPAEGIFVCEQCGGKCSTQANLQRHMRQKHSGAHTSGHVNEQPIAPSLTEVNACQNQATTIVNGAPIEDAGKSSTTGWLLAMCNVSVKKELTQ
ncbi:hypothetical protein AAVH_17114 [Aphelenchoides avenae]|nr:hypothetical protein AAVH_17114 [Aphelenchus avenae]